MNFEAQDEVRSALAEAIRAKPGHSATSLAKQLGRDGTYIRDFLRGKKNTLGAAEIDRLEQLLGVSLRPSSKALEPERSSVVPAPDAPSFDAQAGGLRDVPELGIAIGGSDGDFELNGTIVDYVRRPPALLHRKVFAVRVKNDSMEPRFEEGDILYVDYKREPRPGEYVVIEFHPTADAHPGRALVKRLVSKATGTVIVEQFNPPKQISFNRDHVRALYRVIPNNELIGV